MLSHLGAGVARPSNDLTIAVHAWPHGDVRSTLGGCDAAVCTASLLDDSSAGDLLSSAERDRAATIPNDTVRRRFVTGRATLRTVLGEALGVSPRDVVLHTGAYGKPLLRHGDIHFNVSHSDDLMVVALSRMLAVGIDVERVRAIPRWEGIAARAFGDAKLSELRAAALAEPQPGRAFLRVWCELESVLKAKGMGIGALEAYRISPRPVSLRVTHIDELPLPPPLRGEDRIYHCTLASCLPDDAFAGIAVEQ